ncbi:hypothetical protein U7128_000111 [Bacillus phage KKP_4050]
MDVEMTRAKNKVLLYLGERFDKVVFNEYRTQIIQNNDDDLSQLYEDAYRYLGWTDKSMIDNMLFFECNDAIPVIFFPNTHYCLVWDDTKDKWLGLLIESSQDWGLMINENRVNN